MNELKRYFIGIDLGTTQSALAYVDTWADEPKIQFLSIPQFFSQREISSLPTLPSLVYIPEEGLTFPQAPWTESDSSERPIVGEYARELGASVPSRLIHSAKSWLSHPRIDPRSPILPWQSDAVSEKLSPVEASANYLKHLLEAWNYQIAGKDSDLEFSKQRIAVTVPASFDPAARDLTIEAIKLAGYPEVTLLEEPQAAFYDYIFRFTDKIRDKLGKAKTVLVVDVGGGTSDFSLISVEWPNSKSASPTPTRPEFSRISVGPHLLIGGDNIDLAIARIVEEKLKHRGKRLMTRQWLSVLNQSRRAKEQVFSDSPPKSIAFTILGTGSSIIGGTIKEEVSSDELKKIILDGFFPIVPSSAKPTEAGTFGLSEAGLPYSRDPGMTRHLAAFLAENAVFPDAVLFNGGTLSAPILIQRLMDQLTTWNKGKKPILLDNPHPTLAVASGAVCYSLSRTKDFTGIKSGSPVALYLGIGNGKNSRPGKYVPDKLLVLLSLGSPTEKIEELKGKTIGIERGKDSAFYLFFTASPTPEEKIGDLIKYNWRKHKPLPHLIASAEEKKTSSPDTVEQATLSVNFRETGLFQIFCHGVDGSFHKELSFSVSGAINQKKKTSSTKKSRSALLKREISAIKKLLDELSSPTADRNAFNASFKKLEDIIELPRKDWEISTLRAIFDMVAGNEAILKTQAGFVCFLRLAGFALRPGFGALNDDERIEMIWNLFQKSHQFDDAEYFSEWWLLWKRIGAGLSTERQEALVASVEHSVFPPKKTSKELRKVEQHEKSNIWRMLANLERIPVSLKEKIGAGIIQTPFSFSRDTISLYTLGRLGARELLYADHTFLVPRETVTKWAQELLKRVSMKISYLDWALREYGRKTGDRMVQVEEATRKLIIDSLKVHDRKKDFMAPLYGIKRLEASDFAESCGETLPSGFLWVRDEGEEEA
ncbi:MAG: Hsp70 family protein [Candidatus Riflebacteria bacterium]|nr:Hsp70 family protein [Candidatus Riflebacteria bacterium]